MVKKSAKKSAKKGKAAIIREYLSKNPSHTWKDAEQTLATHGITSAYFAMTKSNHKKRWVPKAELAAGSRANGSDPADAVAFARACGGIENAIAALEELRKLQV
jgi:hypothetical protein